jgi:hypothetical protein
MVVVARGHAGYDGDQNALDWSPYRLILAAARDVEWLRQEATRTAQGLSRRLRTRADRTDRKSARYGGRAREQVTGHPQL